jgi:hypothetical protein
MERAIVHVATVHLVRIAAATVQALAAYGPKRLLLYVGIHRPRFSSQEQSKLFEVDSDSMWGVA